MDRALRMEDSRWMVYPASSSAMSDGESAHCAGMKKGMQRSAAAHAAGSPASFSLPPRSASDLRLSFNMSVGQLVLHAGCMSSTVKISTRQHLPAAQVRQRPVGKEFQVLQLPLRAGGIKATRLLNESAPPAPLAPGVASDLHWLSKIVSRKCFSSRCLLRT